MYIECPVPTSLGVDANVFLVRDCNLSLPKKVGNDASLYLRVEGYVNKEIAFSEEGQPLTSKVCNTTVKGDLTGIDVYEVAYTYALTIPELEKGIIVK